MLRALCARRAVAALVLKRFVAPPSDLIPKAAWIGDDGRFAKIERNSDRIFVDSLTGEGIWLPAVGGDEIEASSVKKKRRKKMNKHKHKKLRRRDRYSKKKK